MQTIYGIHVCCVDRIFMHAHMGRLYIGPHASTLYMKGCGLKMFVCAKHTLLYAPSHSIFAYDTYVNECKDPPVMCI